MKMLISSVAAIALIATPAVAAQKAAPTSTKTVTTKSGDSKATTTVSTKGNTTTAKTTVRRGWLPTNTNTVTGIITLPLRRSWWGAWC